MCIQAIPWGCHRPGAGANCSGSWPELWAGSAVFASSDVAQEPCRRPCAVDIWIFAHLAFPRLLRKNITYCGLLSEGGQVSAGALCVGDISSQITLSCSSGPLCCPLHPNTPAASCPASALQSEMWQSVHLLSFQLSELSSPRWSCCARGTGVSGCQGKELLCWAEVAQKSQ